MSGISLQKKTWSRWILGSALIAAQFGGVPPAQAVRLPESPLRQALIVTANVRESKAGRDLRNPGDMRLFVGAVLDEVRYDPDVLLLQEVRRKSARFIVNELSSRTGSNYRLVVDPGPDPWRKGSNKAILTETAIVLNTDTMRTIDGGGYVRTSFSRREARRGVKPVTKSHAFMLAGEDGSSFSLPLASVHFSLDSELRTQRVAKRKRKEWARIVSSKLADRYGAKTADRARVIGGDFNAGRCAGGTRSWQEDCNLSPFWRYLTADRGYRDSVWTADAMVGVDIVFTNKSVVNAGIDRGKASYSDHRFRWAIVGGDDQAPPVTPSAETFTWDAARVKIDWTESSDGWSVLAGYEVWKSTNGDDFRKIRTSRKTVWSDLNVQRGKTYWYYVRALDGAGNKSAPSNIERAVPGRP
jgi:hypothetical protein